MKDKSIKQPWPRSARVTVWVLGILLFVASANVWLLCEKVQEYKNAPRTELLPIDGERFESEMPWFIAEPCIGPDSY